MWFMGSRRGPFAALIVGILLFQPAGASYATTCVAIPVKPIHHVCGIVIDPLGEPISNAKVTILKGETELVTVQTGVDGKFSIEPLEARNYGLRVRSTGFQTAQSPIVVVKPQAKCKRVLEVVLAVGMGCSGMALVKPKPAN
jgi:hypothetical protein